MCLIHKKMGSRPPGAGGFFLLSAVVMTTGPRPVLAAWVGTGAFDMCRWLDYEYFVVLE